MQKTLVVLAIGAGLLTACKSSSEEPLSTEPEQAAVTTDVGRTFELRPGQTARVGNSGLLVGFRGVGQDSRCPVNVNCVWSGDAALLVPVTIGRMAWTSLDLHTHVDPRSARFRDYTITVVGLQPDPRAGESIPGDRYVVTLRVE